MTKSKILLVDDSPENLQVLMEILREDYAIIAATSAAKALELAAKAPVPDLIILDVVMPEMDGYEVCTRLKANPLTQGILVVFVTALNEVGNEAKGFEFGAVDYISKPFNPVVVKARIKSHLALQQLRQELEQKNNELARSTHLKDEFLANMSHELRTPLNVILGMSESLYEEVLGSLNQRQLKALETIEKSGRHLLELINDILDLSKIAAGKMELELSPTSLKSLCQSSLLFVKQQAFEKHIHISLDLPPELGRVILDELRMRQVLINLLINAVKFTPEGGEVNLKVSIQDCDSLGQDPSRLASEAENAAELWFQVQDSGIGIAPEDLPRLFQAFTQIDSSLNRTQAGTGLGLVMVKQIVELHGGSVGVESSLGIGSCFTVRLPYEPSLAQISPPATLSPPQTAVDAVDSPAEIAPLLLMAEDNPDNISTFSSYLTAQGYRLLIAHDGEEAVALAKARCPDLILMDIQMPNMDGFEAMRQIRAVPQLANVPIIALTALAMKGDLERCMAAGATHHLTKPIKLKQLVESIQQFLLPSLSIPKVM